MLDLKLSTQRERERENICIIDSLPNTKVIAPQVDAYSGGLSRCLMTTPMAMIDRHRTAIRTERSLVKNETFVRNNNAPLQPTLRSVAH